MRILKIILIVSLLITFFSCDVIDNLFNSEENPSGNSSIIGQWKENNAVINLILTTKSDQQATNFLNSTGEIAVTGDYSTKLQLMLYLKGDAENDPALMVINSPSVAGMTDTSYTLYLDPTGADTNGELDVYVDDDSNFDDNLTNPNFNSNFDEPTLTVTNSTVTSGGSGKSASLNGSITLEKVNIPANQPTTLTFNSEHFYDFGQTVTTFNEDSSFTSSEDTGIGDSTGTWLIVGDTLKITVTQEVEDPNTAELTLVDTTLTFGYVNTGNEFIISQSFDVCEGLPAEGTEDEMGCNDLYNTIELLFDLDEGSITNAELIYQLFFEKIPDGQTAKILSESKDLSTNPSSIDILQYIRNIKKLINL